MYEKHTWSNGEIIDADKLNHIEDGISEGVIVIEEGVYAENASDLIDAVRNGKTVIAKHGSLYSTRTVLLTVGSASGLRFDFIAVNQGDLYSRSRILNGNGAWAMPTQTFYALNEIEDE